MKKCQALKEQLLQTLRCITLIPVQGLKDFGVYMNINSVLLPVFTITILESQKNSIKISCA